MHVTQSDVDHASDILRSFYLDRAVGLIDASTYPDRAEELAGELVRVLKIEKTRMTMPTLPEG